MEQTLRNRLLVETQGVLDQYDLDYSEHCLVRMLERWWIQQGLVSRAPA